MYLIAVYYVFFLLDSTTAAGTWRVCTNKEQKMENKIVPY